MFQYMYLVKMISYFSNDLQQELTHQLFVYIHLLPPPVVGIQIPLQPPLFLEQALVPVQLKIMVIISSCPAKLDIPNPKGNV